MFHVQSERRRQTEHMDVHGRCILNVSAAEVTAALFELFIYLIAPRRHHKAPILSVSARRHKKYVNRSYKVNLTASNQEETELRFDF